MSGTADSMWAMSGDKNHTDLAYQMANDLGKPQKTLEDLIKFLKTESLDDLMNTIQYVKEVFFGMITFKLTPIIERLYLLIILKIIIHSVSRISLFIYLLCIFVHLFLTCIGKDAKYPFLTETPHEIYEKSNINKAVIFYHTSSVRN